MKHFKFWFCCLMVLITVGVFAADEGEDKKVAGSDHETIVFGAGCFWCVEAVFDRLEGVISAESGYAGGHVANPSYKQVCTGKTGHAEVIRVVFEPSKISVTELLEVFFGTHDPTTLNRQGADVGTQYRSAVFFTTAQQKELTERYVAQLDQSGVWRNKIVTQVEKLDTFYPAENYHQEYFELNKSAPYCRAVIAPKIKKFEKKFKDKLK